MTEWTIIHDNVANAVEHCQLESIDAVLSDPPYGLGFMAKGWDRQVPGPALWQPIIETMKPGASIFAYSGTRTQHHLALALEASGLEIRDTLLWLYGSGFPKSHNFGAELGDNWDGYGTALKPAYEPIIWAMKQRTESFATNAELHGVAGLNIDQGRIKGEIIKTTRAVSFGGGGPTFSGGNNEYTVTVNDQGRWPANVQVDEYVAERLGHVGRYFYCAKASRVEKEAGLDRFRGQIVNDGRETAIDNAYQRGDTERRNSHPTVKPVDLCRHYAAMLLPPPRDTPRCLLVPFSGSGSEVIGALLAGWDRVIGIELNEEYCEIARARLEHWERWRCATSKMQELEEAGQKRLI